MGDRPQAILNEQIVKSCDLLVGVFWSRIGTPTGKAVSGTVEEIEEMRAAGKPVLLYFSSQPPPADAVDSEQYKKLNEFRSWCRDKALIESYTDLSDFKDKLERQLNTTFSRLRRKTPPPASASAEIFRRSPHLDKFMERYQGVIATFTAEWNAERDTQPVSTERGKDILAQLRSALANLNADPAVSSSPNIKQFFHSVLVKTNQAFQTRMMIDGGRSYQALWNSGTEVFTSLNRPLNLNAAVRPYVEKFFNLFRKVAGEAGALVQDNQPLPKFVVLPNEPTYDGHVEIFSEARFKSGRRWSIAMSHGGANPAEERPPDVEITLSQPGEVSHGINYLVLRFQSLDNRLQFGTGTPIESVKDFLNTEPQPVENFESTISGMLQRLAEHEAQ